MTGRGTSRLVAARKQHAGIFLVIRRIEVDQDGIEGSGVEGRDGCGRR